MTEQQDLIPMGTGEALRRARLQRKRSIEAAARALKVPVNVVEAIEANELERFARVYRKGYVRSYAQYLGFSEERIAELLDDVVTADPELRPAFSLGASRRRSSDRWLRAAGYALGSLLIGTLAWQLTHEAVRLSQVGGEQPEPYQQPGLEAVVSAPDSRVAPAETGSHVNASIAALEDLRRNRGGAATGAGQQVWQALNDEAAARAGEPDVDPGHVLRVSTSGDSWVEIVDARGEQLEMDLLRGGSEREYHGMAPFQIRFGRASAVHLFLDGRLVDTSDFTSGNVTQMSLNADNRSGPSADEG